jgi:hypothetical protein
MAKSRLATKPPRVSPDFAIDLPIGALQTDLERAGEPGKELGHFVIDELAPGLEVKMNMGSGLADEPENRLGPSHVPVEGGVEGKDLRDPAPDKKVELPLEPFQGKAPDR